MEQTIQQKKSVLLGLKLINDWLKFQQSDIEKQIKKLEIEVNGKSD